MGRLIQILGTVVLTGWFASLLWFMVQSLIEIANDNDDQ